MTVDLSSFRKDASVPARGRIVQGLWHLASCFLIQPAWLLGSSWRIRILRLFGAQIGHGVQIKTGVRIKFPWKLAIGDNSWIGEDCWIDNMADVVVGRNVCLSQDCYLCTGNHDWADPSFSMFAQEIRLEDGCWVASRCTLGPGVTIGRNAIAGIGSVVHRSIPRDEVHSGNPAIFRRNRNLLIDPSLSEDPLIVGANGSARHSR